MPPLVILRGTGQEEGWTFTDRVLAVALEEVESWRCPGCGHPRFEAYNPDAEGWYEDREAVCHGCRPLELAASNERQPQPGLKRWTVDVRPPEVELAPWPAQPGQG